MIYEALPLAYNDGANLAAREKMALASTYAGLAFTRANVGNVHAIAHQLGGKYHTPHGLANAIMLPHVLRFSAPEITARLAALGLRARVGNEGESESELADRFLDSVEALAASVGIPRQLDALRDRDIPALAEAACWEADTNYPVPRRMTQDECEAMLRAVLPREPQAKHTVPVKKAARRKAAPAAAAKRPRRKSAKAK
jgi:alcohol dehydrogenase class IV